MKLKELAENASTVAEAFSVMEALYGKNYNLHMCRKKQGWLCRVMKVKKVVTGSKEVEYQESFLLKEEGDSFVEAFKKGALAVLK